MGRAMTVYCDKCGAEITLEPSQSIYLGKSKSYDLCLKCYDSIAEKLADVEKEIFKENQESCPNRCVACKYFDERLYYADNSINISACAAGSCTKCNRNITSTNPNTEVPSWCPLKGEENE